MYSYKNVQRKKISEDMVQVIKNILEKENKEIQFDISLDQALDNDKAYYEQFGQPEIITYYFNKDLGVATSSDEIEVASYMYDDWSIIDEYELNELYGILMKNKHNWK